MKNFILGLGTGAIALALIIYSQFISLAETKIEFPDLSHKIDDTLLGAKCVYMVGGIFGTGGIVDYECGKTPKWEQFTDGQKNIIKDGVIAEISKESLKFGINPREALDIAYCESRYNPFVTNAKSSAKGVYQFTNRTWEKYCLGNPFDYFDNIKCFMKLYPQNKNWWQCKA